MPPSSSPSCASWTTGTRISWCRRPFTRASSSPSSGSSSSSPSARGTSSAPRGTRPTRWSMCSTGRPFSWSWGSSTSPSPTSCQTLPSSACSGSSSLWRRSSSCLRRRLWSRLSQGRWPRWDLSSRLSDSSSCSLELLGFTSLGAPATCFTGAVCPSRSTTRCRTMTQRRTRTTRWSAGASTSPTAAWTCSGTRSTRRTGRRRGWGTTMGMLPTCSTAPL
mmetsp:Transcript_28461/g.72040  ORF Transcript_28461/g.72040 Transcript_28461/m.72040 type:complete len:220 (-) Transcript_28461:51-710(-)